MRPRLELGFALAVVLAAGCTSKAPVPAASPGTHPSAAASATLEPGATPTPVPVHISSNGNGGVTTLSEMKDRRTIYIVRAKSFEGDTIAGRTDTGSGTFEHPEITFIDRHGSKTVTVAPKAVLTSADKSVLMTGGVTARSQDGNVLSCDRLRYDGTTERIHGEGNVVMRTPAGFTLSGDVIDGDARLQNVHVFRK